MTFRVNSKGKAGKGNGNGNGKGFGIPLNVDGQQTPAWQAPAWQAPELVLAPWQAQEGWWDPEWEVVRHQHAKGKGKGDCNGDGVCEQGEIDLCSVCVCCCISAFLARWCIVI